MNAPACSDLQKPVGVVNASPRRLAALVLAAAAVGASLLSVPVAAASGGCESIPWGFLGSQTRQICDGPIQGDGSWLRTRIIGVPAHYVNPSSSCYSGSYSSRCTFYPGGWVDDRIASNDTYPVTADTVLPDEPGHLQ